jgi:predicted DNA-binding protein YlxM (UPF0122 family)
MAKDLTTFPEKGNKHVSASLVSLSSFAKRKNVTRHAVYYHIKVSGRIIPTLVGMDKDLYIDWKSYKDFEFKDLKPTNK